MVEYVQADLHGSCFHDVDLSGSEFRAVFLRDVVMRGCILLDVTIDAEVRNLVVNGVDVAPLVEAELDRRHPERARMRPTDPTGFREAWDIVERLWAGNSTGPEGSHRSSCTRRWTPSGRSWR